MRSVLKPFISHCKGYYARTHSQISRIYSIVQLKHKEELELKKAGNKNYRQAAEVNMQKRLAELDREYTLKEIQREEENSKANELVDDVFEFLKDSGLPSSPNDVSESKAFVVSGFLSVAKFTSKGVWFHIWLIYRLFSQFGATFRKLFLFRL